MTGYRSARCSAPCALFAAMLVAAATSVQASVEISADPTKNMNCSAGVCTPTAKNAVLNASDLANMLASSDVKILTGSGAMTITVSSSFSWTSTHHLTLDAYYNVSFRAPVVVAGQGTVTIVSNDGGTGGDLIFFPGASLDFWDTSSNLVINNNSYALVRNLKSLRKAVIANPFGYIALAKNHNALHDGTFNHSPGGEFGGVFEGLGHVISFLAIDDPRDKHDVGLFAESSGTLRDVGLERVNVTGQSDRVHIGALVAVNDGSVVGSHVTGTVVGGQYAFIGGLVGQNYGQVARSYSAASVSGGLTVGGLVGQNDYGTISRSFTNGAISGGFYIGGLVGSEYGDESLLTLSYSTAAVTSNANTEDLGGLVGNYGDGFGGAISESYATGALGPPRWYTGGLIGLDTANPTNVSSTYWNLDTSGVDDPSHGAGSPSDDPGITGLTDAQFKSDLPSGFDPAMWGQRTSINNGYPYLLANPPP